MIYIMRVALAQIPCVLGDKEANLGRMRRTMSRVEADLYVFPELFLTGYMVRDEIYRLAECMDGPSIAAVGAMAAETGAHVLFGMAVRDSMVPGVLRNSAVLISPLGRAQRYDKINLASFGPFEESLYFAPGSAPAMMDVNGTKIGAVICYDLFFPELIRQYALQGAQAIVCISASPVTSRDFFEKLIPVRAIENSTYCLYVNQVGTQLGQVFFGGAEAVGPTGERLAKASYFEEDIAVVEIDDKEVLTARRMRPTIRDALGRTR